MEKITGYYVDEDAAVCGLRAIDDDLHAYYALLGCELVQAVPVYIAGRLYDLICDEEAKCHEPIPGPTAVLIDCGLAVDLVNGPCFVVGVDEHGEWCSITSEDAKALEGAFASLADGRRLLLADVRP